MRSFALALVATVAWARPQPVKQPKAQPAKETKAQPAKETKAQPAKETKAQPVKQLKSLTPATQVGKQLARDAEDVRLLILASPT